jgi:putative ABC transport system permease protein
MTLELRAALRSLSRSPGFVLAVVLSLALGIGAGATAFGVLDAVRLRSLPFPGGDRLVVLGEVPAEGAPTCRLDCDVSYATYANLLRLHPPRTLESLAAYTGGGKTLGTSGEPLLVLGGIVSSNVFTLLEARPALGRAFTPEDDRLGVPLVTLLSHELWVSQFGGDRAIVGKTIKLSDSHYTVIGVMPPGFDFELRSQFWLPVVPTLDPSTRPSISSVNVIGRLAPGRTLAQLNAELRTLEPGGKVRTRLSATPLRSRYTESTQSHDLIFAAIVACVLLIACANVANLSLVRTLHQLREFALRAALGARPARLARGLLLQHFLLVLFSAAVGLGFARWFLHALQSLEALQSLRPTGMEYRLDLRVAGFALLLALAIAGFLGLVATRVVIRADASRLLREGAPSGGGRGGRLAQQVLVVAQIAAAVALLTGAGLLTRTSARLARVSPGFDAAQAIIASPSYPHPWRVKEKYLPVTRQILVELARLPGTQTVALRAGIALPQGSPLSVEGSASPLSGDLLPRNILSVSPGYFRALGIPVLRGREFSEADLEAAPPVALLNDWAASHWFPGRDAIGRTVRIDTAPAQSIALTVVGVVRNSKAATRNLLLSGDGPELYRPYEQASSAFPTFFLRTAGTPAPLLRPVRQLLARLVPDRPVFASPMAQPLADQLGRVRLNALQIIAFALVGLALALLGIHGVLSYAVGRRTHEIGIRGALGATRGGIERMVLADAARLTLAGLALGLPLAALASKLIRGMLYGTNPRDPFVYAAVALAVIVVSLAAAWAPARRAARVDPLIALRAG